MNGFTNSKKENSHGRFPIRRCSALFGLVSSPEKISPVEKLLNEFDAHEAKENHAREVYKGSIAHMPDPVTRFLMQLIISDEEKHRAVVHAMASTLRGSLN